MARRISMALVVALVVALAGVAVAGDGHHKCTASTQDCLNKMAQKLAAKGWMGIEYDRTEAGPLKITRVVPDSPAEKAGVRSGDVLVAINGAGFGEADEAELKKVSQGMVPGAKLTCTVKRDGAKKNLDMTLAKMPDKVRHAIVGEHMLQHAEYKVAAK